MVKQPSSVIRTRFAPSPTGPLHLGHAYSALLAHDFARNHDGTFLLRIEDLDQSRCRPEWEALLFEDLEWLGITWDENVIYQSHNQDTYKSALTTTLRSHVFPCHCSRRDITAAISAPQDGEPAMGPDGVIYPGTCVDTPLPEPLILDQMNLRLRLDRVPTAKKFHFTETGIYSDDIEFDIQDFVATIGQVVLWRQNYAAYHLASVIDDAGQNITHVIRGADLFEATKIHVLLQHLLGFETPVYHHHKLITDENGKRLAKRHDAKSIKSYRDAGYSPDEIRKMVGLSPSK